MAALEISKKCLTQRHLPHDLPTWGQIKTLTNQAENLVSQQGMPWNPENLLNCYAPSVGLLSWLG